MSSPNATLSDIEDDRLSNDKSNANDSDNEVKDKEKEKVEEKAKDSENKKKRSVQNPQPKLDAERLKGAKGIHAIEEHFADFKFRGKGYEKADLDIVMKKLEHWSHRLFPKFDFDASLSKFETLGTKKAVQTHLKRIRLGLWTKDDIEGNSKDVIEEDDDLMREEDSAPIDEFDALIAEQLEKQRQASTTPQRAINNVSFSSFGGKETPRKSFDEIARGSGYSKATETIEITNEMKEKIEMNRQLAMQKRLARIQAEEAEKRETDSQMDEQNLTKDKDNENNVEMIIDDSNEIQERIERNRQLAIKKRLARIEAEEAKKRQIETQDKEENQTVDNDNENNVETMLEESITKNLSNEKS